jgi:hypothetical protein
MQSAVWFDRGIRSFHFGYNNAVVISPCNSVVLMNKEAKNMEAIYKAKKHHDENCQWQGEGKRIYMCGFDIERMGWEEGDVIAGLILIIDAGMQTGRFRVECDNEPNAEPEVKEETKEKDLVHA